MTSAQEDPIDEVVAAQIHAPIEAQLELEDDRWTLVMRRRFPHGPQRLWGMLTDPERLARWSPVVPDRPLTTPGPASCRESSGDDPIDAEVLVADAPWRLVHRWGPELLSWTITATEGAAVLELRQRLHEPGYASVYAGGWQVCLGRLAADGEGGVERERVVGERALAYGCQELIERHRAAFAGQMPQNPMPSMTTEGER